ncbi:ComEA family DNA-binding protein [Microbacterium arborescens]|uniref:ComEA family DNA-binding protein n=1 Tax=Microbacterium arborescens TaxID=33883 RepID=UPI002782F28F|nr:ComEA family DNA-binding protein [Microbacterium arborescens]MDQ1216185.1 competence protein ComEA [Microbacterium arborescens]
MTAPDPAPARRRLGIGALVVLVLAAAAVTVAIGMIRSLAAPVAVVSPVVTPTFVSDADTAAVYVHVHGAVVSPGLYRLDADARVVDAVAAAGGFSDTADPAGVNLARTVTDGEQLFVPEPGQAPPASAGGGPSGEASAGGLVDLNTADAAALDTLPRVGPALAERIIAWREENGRFTSVEDLLAVSGIGEKMLEALRERVRV